MAAGLTAQIAGVQRLRKVVELAVHDAGLVRARRDDVAREAGFGQASDDVVEVDLGRWGSVAAELDRARTAAVMLGVAAGVDEQVAQLPVYPARDAIFDAVSDVRVRASDEADQISRVGEAWERLCEAADSFDRKYGRAFADAQWDKAAASSVFQRLKDGLDVGSKVGEIAGDLLSVAVVAARGRGRDAGDVLQGWAADLAEADDGGRSLVRGYSQTAADTFREEMLPYRPWAWYGQFQKDRDELGKAWSEMRAGLDEVKAARERLRKPDLDSWPGAKTGAVAADVAEEAPASVRGGWLRAASGASKGVGKSLGMVGTAVSVASAGFDAYDAYENTAGDETQRRTAAAVAVGEDVAVAGMGATATTAGAVIGTALIPIPGVGTAVGLVAGMAVGAAVSAMQKTDWYQHGKQHVTDTIADWFRH